MTVILQRSLVQKQSPPTNMAKTEDDRERKDEKAYETKQSTGCFLRCFPPTLNLVFMLSCCLSLTSNSECPATDEADTSFENHSCMSWARPAMHRQDIEGKHHCKNHSFLPSYTHFLTLHCLMFSAITDHTSALCFWALEAIPSTQSKVGQCENKCQRDLLKPTQKWSSLDLQVPSDCFLRKRTLKTAWRLVLRNYSKWEKIKVSKTTLFSRDRITLSI